MSTEAMLSEETGVARASEPRLAWALWSGLALKAGASGAHGQCDWNACVKDRVLSPQ